MKHAIFAVLLTLAATASAADRNVMLLQQLEPGHIISVILVEHGGHVRVGIRGMGASTVNKSAEISVEEFARLWTLANSKELAVYRLTSKDQNMADPNYFTVTVGADGKADFDLRIPVKGQNERAAALTSSIRRHIDE
jgi:hypothetical protein